MVLGLGCQLPVGLADESSQPWSKFGPYGPGGVLGVRCIFLPRRTPLSSHSRQLRWRGFPASTQIGPVRGQTWSGYEEADRRFSALCGRCFLGNFPSSRGLRCGDLLGSGSLLSNCRFLGNLRFLGHSGFIRHGFLNCRIEH